MKLEKKHRGESLSTRELVLLVVLGVVLLGAAIGNFILLPEWENFKQLSETIDTIESSTVVMEAEYAKKDQIAASIEERKLELIEESMYVPTYLSQDEIIRVLNKYLFDADVKASNIGFTENVEIPVKEYVSSLPFFSEPELNMMNFNGQVIESVIKLSVTGEYENIYRFLSLLEANNQELHINSVNLSDNEEGMAGSITLTFIGYKDMLMLDNYQPSKIIDNEKNNIFTPYDSYIFGEGSSASRTLLPDFAIIVLSAYDVAPKVSMMEYGVPNSEIFVDGNQSHTINFSVWEDNGEVYYSYELGGNTVSEKHSLVNNDGVMVLDVYSRSRDDNGDNVSVIVNVDNKTNNELNIRVLHDDTSRPRFILGNVTGEVLVK